MDNTNSTKQEEGIYLMPDAVCIYVTIRKRFNERPMAIHGSKENYFHIMDILKAHGIETGRMSLICNQILDLSDWEVEDPAARYLLLEDMKININTYENLADSIIKNVAERIPKARIQIGYMVNVP